MAKGQQTVFEHKKIKLCNLSSLVKDYALHTYRITIFDSVTNTYANLEMKEYVKYLGLMIDSNLSWKYHVESICREINKSIGVMAKIRHYVPSGV